MIALMAEAAVTFLLRDSSTSEGIEMFASAAVLYFDAA